MTNLLTREVVGPRKYFAIVSVHDELEWFLPVTDTLAAAVYEKLVTVRNI